MWPIRRAVPRPRHTAQLGHIARAGQGLFRGRLGLIQRIGQGSDPRQLSNPAHQRQHNRRHDEHRRAKHNHRRAVAIISRAKQDQRRQRKDKGTKKRRQNRLCFGILGQQAVNARRGLIRQGPVRGHHHTQRKRHHRQHPVSQNRQNGQGRGLGKPVLGAVGDIAIKQFRRKRRQKGQRGIKRHAHPQHAAETARLPIEPCNNRSGVQSHRSSKCNTGPRSGP